MRRRKHGRTVARTGNRRTSEHARSAACVLFALALVLVVTPLRHADASYLRRVTWVSGIGGSSSGPALFPAVSADGRWVAFQAETSAGPSKGMRAQVYVRDTSTDRVACVSALSSSALASGPSGAPAISADGRYVAFTSAAPDLVAGDTNGVWDVFVRDTADGTTVRVSVDSRGRQADGDSISPAISADGRYVAFVSSATSLVSGDGNGCDDVFVRDLKAGTTRRVSLTAAGAEANGPSAAPCIDSSGHRIAFSSVASNLVSGDANGASDIFVRDTASNSTSRASVGVGGGSNLGSWAPSISSDGRKVAFESLATNLVAGDGNAVRDVFVRDLDAGTTARVSVASSGVEGDGESKSAAISGDGKSVAFASTADSLVANDTNRLSDVFVRDLATNTTERVSVAQTRAQATGASNAPSLSRDGADIAFASEAPNLVADDADRVSDVFAVTSVRRVFERVAGQTRIDTAIEASKRAFPDRAGTVVVATARNWPDALGGAALAGVVDGPVLLTEPASLPDALAAEIRRLGPQRIYVLGAKGAVAPTVANALASLPGSPRVRRLGGSDRYATAALIASETVSVRKTAWDGRVVVATGGDYPDALAASPVCFAQGTPIVLARPAGGAPQLPAKTSSAVVLGGELAVPKKTYDGLAGRLGYAKVRRIKGQTRYATAVAVAEWGAALQLRWDGLAFCTGENFPDALSGGAMAGKLGSLMLLTRTATLPPDTAAALREHALAIGRLRVLGKPMAVSDATLAQADKAFGD